MKTCVIVLLFFACASAAFRILIVFPMPMRSHGLLGDAAAKILADAGHEVTLITPFPDPKLGKIVNIVDFSSLLNHPVGKIFVDNKSFTSPQVNRGSFPKLMSIVYTLMLEDRTVRKLLEDPSVQFDLVMAEWLYTELVSGLSVLYNCPNIWVSPLELNFAILRLIDETLNPAYGSLATSINIPPYNFFQRVKELWEQILYIKEDYFDIGPSDRIKYKEIFGPLVASRGRILPAFEELRYNASMVFGYSHASTGFAYRLPQNYINLSGFHISTDIKPLPENLQKIMDSSENGVIYFSLGTGIKGKSIPKELVAALLKTLGRFNQTVLWKFDEKLDNVPQNVHLLEWAPQQSILAHPKCIIFITHGGLCSMTEAVHFGVPLIGIPIFADQFNNIARAVQKGFAKRVDKSINLAQNLQIAVEEVLNDPRYMTKAKEWSFIYHDRAVSPRKELVHWVEHVVRTGGAPHLRSPALMVPWYQKMYLDLLVSLISLLYCIKKLFCYILREVIQKKFKRHAAKKYN